MIFQSLKSGVCRQGNYYPETLIILLYSSSLPFKWLLSSPASLAPYLKNIPQPVFKGIYYDAVLL